MRGALETVHRQPTQTLSTPSSHPESDRNTGKRHTADQPNPRDGKNVLFSSPSRRNLMSTTPDRFSGSKPTRTKQRDISKGRATR